MNTRQQETSLLMNRRVALAASAFALTAASQAWPCDATTSKPRIKIGQIGVGHAHASKLSVYRDSPDFEVVGIVEPDERLRESAETSAAFKDLKWLTRNQLLETPGLQAVLVETRVRDALDNAEECVKAGKHVHIDKPSSVTSFNQHSGKFDDGLLDNMLAVLSYSKATATVKSSALEVEGGDRRHLVVCGTEGTFHIQPLDNPSARVSLSQPCGKYSQGTQEIRFPKYTRYIDDAADMARIIRGEKPADFSPDHDHAVQETLLRACGLSVE